MRARKLLLRAVIGALCVTAGIAVLVLLAGRFDNTSWRILATTTAVSFFGLLGVPAGALLEQRRAVALARVSATLTLAGFVLTIALVWRDWTDVFGKTWGVVMTLALAAAQAAAVESRRRESDTPTIGALAATSTVTAVLLAAMGVAAILGEIADQTYYRALGALGVVDLLLVTIVAILRRGVGPSAATYSVRVDGMLVEVPARDFAGAAATAIRRAERDGTKVTRVERA